MEQAGTRMRLVVAVLGSAAASLAIAQTPAAPAHTNTQFQVTVRLPYDQAAPLFGAWAEQKWAPEWNPQFVYPWPAADQAGAVFKVPHGEHTSFWITSVFDLRGGHIQYVYVLEQLLITRIDILLSKSEPNETSASVTYERTALDPAAAGHVNALAKRDAAAAAEWQRALDAYASKVRNRESK